VGLHLDDDREVDVAAEEKLQAHLSCVQSCDRPKATLQIDFYFPRVVEEILKEIMNSGCKLSHTLNVM
jgi:hypothetical protein